MYYCEYCKQECDPKPVDTGIGPYEFQGARGVDTCMELESSCCEAAVYTNEACTWKASYAMWSSDQDDARADYLYDERRDREG